MDKEASTLSEVPSEVATAAEQSSPQVAPLPVAPTVAAASAAAHEQLCFLSTAPAPVYILAGVRFRAHVNIILQSSSQVARADSHLLSCCKGC